MTMTDKIATDKIANSATNCLVDLRTALEARCKSLQARIFALEAAYMTSIRENGEDSDRTIRISAVLTGANNRWSRADERRGWVCKAISLLGDAVDAGGRPKPWPFR